MNVKNIQLQIAENCTKENKEIINKYWERKNNEFVNKPKYIADSLKIPSHSLYALIQNESSLDFEVLCSNCNTFKQVSVHSQTGFKESAKKNYICNTCKESINEKKRIAEEEDRQKLIKKLSDAIKNKNWKNLTPFQFKLLHDIINESNISILKHKYTNVPQNKFWSAIYTLRDFNLVVLDYEYGNSVRNIYCYAELATALPEIENINNLKDGETNSFDQETNELRFRLTKNPNPFSYDSPEYSGTLEFSQTVILKPGVEYSFGAWKRQNEVLYLSIIPTEDKPKLPKQKNKEW